MRIGIIGTGRIAEENVPALLRTGRVRIAALCNRTVEKAERLKSQWGLEAPVYADYRAMLDRERLDAVLIETPHGQHAGQFCACAERGLHVMVEKPLAADAADARVMIEAAKRHGVRAAVCHTQRYLAPMRALRDFLRQGGADELGALVSVTDVLNFHYFHEQRPAWYFDPAQAGGGMLLTHGAHQIDRIHHLAGAATSALSARVERRASGTALDSGYQLLGDAGGVGYVAVCTGLPSPHASSLLLGFERGAVRVHLFDCGLEKPGVYVGRGDGRYEPLAIQYRAEDTYVRQFEALLDHLEGRDSDAPTLIEAYQVMRVLDAAVAAEHALYPLFNDPER
ncbi:Gfo/Idh/MocA family protein [Bacillota bacterium Meth-B3]